jgi:hypothetical protein
MPQASSVPLKYSARSSFGCSARYFSTGDAGAAGEAEGQGEGVQGFHGDSSRVWRQRQASAAEINLNPIGSRQYTAASAVAPPASPGR